MSGRVAKAEAESEFLKQVNESLLHNQRDLQQSFEAIKAELAKEREHVRDADEQVRSGAMHRRIKGCNQTLARTSSFNSCGPVACSAIGLKSLYVPSLLVLCYIKDSQGHIASAS